MPSRHGYESSCLAAVYAPELTREAIYYAIKNRRTYGTTGERILLKFEINGHMMGSEFRLDGGSFPQIDVTVGGTNKLEEVEVVKYSRSSGWQTIHVECPTTSTCTFTYIDANFTEDSLYYIRVTQAGEPPEMAWSSPIWVNKIEDNP